MASRFVLPCQLSAQNVVAHSHTRFAAKEAVFKATPEKLGFHDVIIRKKPSGQPFAVVKSSEEDRLDREVLLSISHDGNYATAVAIAALDAAYPAEQKAMMDDSAVTNTTPRIGPGTEGGSTT
jgi:4'-phosphopantetheinyl transferase EntD